MSALSKRRLYFGDTESFATDHQLFSMGDPLSVAAGVVGIAAPTLHYVRLLMQDLQAIVDAPDAIKTLTDELEAVSLALASVQAITDPQWKSLGEDVANQSKAAITLCKESCERFKASLDGWTRHSKDGSLSWRDRTKIGFLKQSHIKSMSEQLRNCHITLASVASIATL